jgi:hypothetical protein
VERHFEVLRIIKTWKFRKERDAVSYIVDTAEYANRTEIKLLPGSEDPDGGPSCQSNVAKCQDKGCENDYFSFITGQKFEGTSEYSAAKKRLSTPHKRAGPRMDDDPVPKGAHRRDGRSRRSQTVVGSTSHAPACLKMC